MKKLMKILVLLVVCLFLYFPVILIAVYSFSTASHMTSIHGFTMNNYRMLLQNSELQRMIINTVLLAVVSALIATFFGTFGAIGSYYSRKKVNIFMNSVNRIPLVNADLITGFSICMLLCVIVGISKDSYIPLIAGHVVLEIPFVYLSVMPKLKQLDSNTFEAALDLGATSGQAVRMILLPQLKTGIITGFMLAITASLDDYFVTTYTKPTTMHTISTYVVSVSRSTHTELKTALWALSTIILVIVIVFAIVINLRSTRISRIRKAGL